MTARGDRCGTPAGWNDHRRCNSEPCANCRAAHAGYVTAYRQRMKLRAAGSRHGTERGLIWHWALGEKVCDLCRSWQRGYMHGLTRECLGARTVPMEVLDRVGVRELFAELAAADGAR